MPIAGILLFSLAVFSCGELDTVLPASSSYQVNATVDNRTLTEVSIVREGNVIYPFFANSVAGDPDVTGLTVILRDRTGAELAATRYTLDAEALAAPRGVSKPESVDSTGTEDAQKAKDAGTTADVVTLKRLDRDIPGFEIPAGTKPGAYTLVFQVRGARESLYEIERPFYYLAGADFSLEGFRAYLPGLASQVARPGVTVMLEAQVSFDPDLRPYIVWYDGKHRIRETAAAEGVNRFFWGAPEQNGFHALRAELFPFKPEKGTAGLSLELSLPVSAKGADSWFSDREMTGSYRFQGNLEDSAAKPGKPFRNDDAAREPVWLPAGGIYGLALENADRYSLKTPPFDIQDGEGGGEILLHALPAADGDMLSLTFNLEDGGQACVTVSRKGNVFTAAVQAAGKQAAAEYVPVHASGESYGFVPLTLAFAAAGGRLAFCLGDGAAPRDWVTAELPSPLAGTDSLVLGAAAVKSVPADTPDAAAEASPVKADSGDSSAAPAVSAKADAAPAFSADASAAEAKASAASVTLIVNELAFAALPPDAFPAVLRESAAAAAADSDAPDVEETLAERN